MSHDLGIDLVEAATKKLDVKVSYQENARDHRRNIRNSYKIDTPASAIQVAEKDFALLIKQVMIAMPVTAIISKIRATLSWLQLINPPS